jgi:hypothetical protein
MFLAHIERGFGVPTDDFFHGLLYFYRIELVHIIPNAITIISSFIHHCEAYLGIPPHFRLWRHFLELKKTSKSDVVGSVGFMLRQFMNLEYIDLVEGPIRRPERGGSEWEPIKILLEGD